MHGGGEGVEGRVTVMARVLVIDQWPCIRERATCRAFVGAHCALLEDDPSCYNLRCNVRPELQVVARAPPEHRMSLRPAFLGGSNCAHSAARERDLRGVKPLQPARRWWVGGWQGAGGGGVLALCVEYGREIGREDRHSSHLGVVG